MDQEKNRHHEIYEKVYLMFIQNKVKFVLYFILSILFIIFLGEKLPFFKKVSVEKLTQLEQQFLDWKKDPNSKDKYLSLFSSLNKVPSFGLMFEPEIAQILMHEENENFKDIGKKVLARTTPSYYVDFSNISLLISEKKYQDAYESSIALKAKLEEMSKQSLMIYPYNLLRICFLMKELNDSEKEIKAWDELEKYISEKQTSFVSEVEKNNKIKLSDFISQRKLYLNKKSLSKKGTLD